MRAIEKKYLKWRILCISILFNLMLAGIGARAVYLQYFKSAWLSQKAASQYERSFVSNGKRGTIYDTHHREMAISIDVTSIAASPTHVKDARFAANALSKVLEVNRKELYRNLASDKSFVWVKRHVTPKNVEAVKKLELEGIVFLPEHQRFYPNKTLAAHALGFSGLDGKGLEGIEFYYNDELEGTSATLTVLKDALGRGFDAEDKPTVNHSGNNLILTIDRTIQYIAENALQEAATTFDAKSGIAIVMAPDTGAVLAMANFPAFNPNSFRHYDRKQWRNRAVTDSFEPGSTMKIFLAAAAIEGKYCTPSSIFYCENGAYRIGPNTVHDTHPHAWLSLQQIVKYSSNIGAVKVSEVSGRKALYNALKNFGFGAKTGIDCPGETSGRLSPYRIWTPIDTAAISFGQGISVSPIQLITAASAIANGGTFMKPYMVKAIMDPEGNIVQSFSPQVVRNVISSQTAGTVRRIMHTVVTEGGTGVEAALETYSVCGKTGTAQKLDESGRYSNRKYVASFLGFAPVEKPEIAVLVLLDEPEKQHYGGIVAAPAFKKIVYETLTYLHALPGDKTERLLVKIKNEANG